WSYTALPDDAARLFRMLALHPGPEFSDAAVAALAGTSVQRTRQMLDVLRGAFMVEQTAHRRYQFHDLLRAYAVDQVNRQESAEERRAVQRRVLTWYLHALDAAQARIEPNELRIPLDPVEDADMTLATFADYDAALTWYEAESANLVTATR